MDLMLEVSLDRNIVLRENYNVLDFLGDIGGVQALLISLVQFMLVFINYGHFDQFMASKLYKIKKPADEDEKIKQYFKRSNFFTPLKCRNFRNYMIDSLPDRLQCCKESR